MAGVPDVEVQLASSPLGLHIETTAVGHEVSRVEPGGLAASSGVTTQHCLCSVGGADVRELDHEAAMSMISAATRPVTLLFRSSAGPSAVSAAPQRFPQVGLPQPPARHLFPRLSQERKRSTIL